MKAKFADDGIQYEWKDKIWFDDKKTSLVGNIFLGRIILNGKNIKAIIKEIPLEKPGHWEEGDWYDSFQTLLKKAFEKRRIPYTAENIAKAYNKTIIELRISGVSLPKMKAVVWKGKLLLISQYFGNKERRKLTKTSKLKELTKKELNEYIDLYAKIINTGYLPTPDLLEYFSGTTQTGFVPLDIDQQVRFKLECDTIDDFVKHFVWKNGPLFFKELDKNESLKVVYAILRKVKSEELRKALYKAMKQEYNLWFRK
jgi:hypothetical protein